MKTIRALIPAAMAVWACSSIWAADALADCDAKAKQSTPTTQFKFLSGGISVLDTKTGLEWQRCPEGMMFAAGKAVDRSLDSCMGTASTFNPTTIKMAAGKVNSSSGLDGQHDWRVPTMDELSSIVESACQIPAINPTVFPGTPVTWFWALQAKSLPSGGQAWGIGFGMGGYYVGNNNYGAVRLVRGAFNPKNVLERPRNPGK